MTDRVASLISTKPKQRRYSISLQTMRKRVYRRDGGICQICGMYVQFEDEYECGHKVDYAVGGSNDEDNLAVMCWRCNGCKPLHRTIEEYEAWASSGGPWPEVLSRVTATAGPGVLEALLKARFIPPIAYGILKARRPR